MSVLRVQFIYNYVSYIRRILLKESCSRDNILFCPISEHRLIRREDQAHDDGSTAITRRDKFGQTIKDFPLSLTLLLKNPTYLFIVLAGIPDAMLTFGLVGFFAKFVENQFSQTVTTSAILSGEKETS